MSIPGRLRLKLSSRELLFYFSFPASPPHPSLPLPLSLSLSGCTCPHRTRQDQNTGEHTKMPVRIRLARHGCRHSPLYHINVANSWAKRDGKFIERLGEYSPFPDDADIKRVALNFDRVKYWLSVGAQPTSTVARLLGKVLPLLCSFVNIPSQYDPLGRYYAFTSPRTYPCSGHREEVSLRPSHQGGCHIIIEETLAIKEYHIVCIISCIRGTRSSEGTAVFHLCTDMMSQTRGLIISL